MIIKAYDRKKQNIFRKAKDSIDDGIFPRMAKTAVYSALIGVLIYGCARIIPPIQKKYDSFRHYSLAKTIAQKDIEISNINDNLSHLNTELSKKEKEILGLNVEISGKEEKIKSLEKKLAETNEQQNALNLKKASLGKLGYDYKKGYFWEGNAEIGYMYYGIALRKGISDEENMLNFERMLQSNYLLDMVLGPDFEKGDGEAALSGKVKYRIKSRFYTKVIKNKQEGFALENEECSEINNGIRRINAMKLY